MRFNLVDQITAVEPGKSLTARKHLTGGEEYLADHFPTFPVMPGVLQLQALSEAGAWLWRLDSDFRFSVVVMREAKNVKYGSFVEPGRTVTLAVEWVSRSDDEGVAVIKGKGTVDGTAVVSAQVTLAAYNLAGRFPNGAELDAQLAGHWRQRAALLRHLGGFAAKEQP